ncbi:sensor histidine kinase [uncultured Microscilla sp.]|uniref:sensor histidine kinase n=1 Tax=uncultured Microscilla sp. TaxID=432653 RepID=UPI00260C431A|nr:histidine kinase [uncultured Microscilla sp.]
MKKKVYYISIGAVLGLIVRAYILFNNEGRMPDIIKEWDITLLSVLLGAFFYPLLVYCNQYLMQRIDRKNHLIRFFCVQFVSHLLIVFALLIPVFIVYVAMFGHFAQTEGLALRPIFTDWYNNRGTSGAIAILLIVSTYNTGGLAAYYFTRLQQTLLETERIERQQLQSQFSVLKSQISPHFLFNSLNALSTMVHKDAQQSEVFIRKLSDIFHYVLQNSHRDLISLQQELEFTKAYCYLLKVRYGRNLEVNMTIDPAKAPGMIPPLTLQMLVENAIKHNEISKDRPLRVHIATQSDFLLVQNNLQVRQQPEASLHIGLNNILSRYVFFTDIKVEVSKTPALFMVKLPLLKPVAS